MIGLPFCWILLFLTRPCFMSRLLFCSTLQTLILNSAKRFKRFIKVFVYCIQNKISKKIFWIWQGDIYTKHLAYCIPSMIIVKLKCQITLLHRVPTGLLNIKRGGQTLSISVHEMAPMRAFSVLQKRPKIAKMTPDDLLSLTIVSSEPLGNTEQNTLLVF